MERSFLADKIKAFPLPDHYLIFETIVELIVSISLVSSCSRLSLSIVVRLQKKGPAQPARPARGGWGAVRLLSAGIGQVEGIGGALLKFGDPASSSLRTPPLPQERSFPLAPHLHARCAPGGRAYRAWRGEETHQARPRRELRVGKL